MEREEVLSKVKECLADVLNISAQDILAESKLVEDLGADSLDFLHLIFALEQKFGVKLTPRDIEKKAKEKLGDIPLEIDGVYTKEGLAELRKAFPEIPEQELKEGLAVEELGKYFRVETLVNLVMRA